jgi:drug/metabolite transporter (DMT)-like permease
MSNDNLPTLRDWLALVLLVLIWGSSFILIKKGLVAFNAMEVGALRITISFVFLLPFAVSRIKKVTRSKWPVFFVAGLLGSGLPPFLFAMAQTVIDSYMAGVLNSLTPLFTLVAGLLFFGTKTRWLNVVGVVVGLAGAIGLLTAVNDPRLGNGILYGLYAVAGAVCYAFNMNIIKRYLGGFDAITITSVIFVFIGIPAALYLFAGTGFVQKLGSQPESWVSLGYIAILAIVGTALSLIIHNWLIRRTSALFASSVTYMMPIISIVWGIIDGERFLLFYLLWITLILVGVYLANRPNRRAVPPSPVPNRRAVPPSPVP